VAQEQRQWDAAAQFGSKEEVEKLLRQFDKPEDD